MITKYRFLSIFLCLSFLMSCVKSPEEVLPGDDDKEVEEPPKVEEPDEEEMPDIFETAHFFTAPTALDTVTFEGTSSADINNLMQQLSQNGGSVIRIPQGQYLWEDIILKSNIHLVFESGAVVKPERSTTRRIFNLGGDGGGDNGRIENVSIAALDERFTVDMNDAAYSNEKILVCRIGRINNFSISGFNIRDRRSAVASICLVFVGNTSERSPFPTNGAITDISQTNAHTGYGLIQCYSADHVLFRQLDCEGGVTLRMETDDRVMKDEIKFGEKEGGIHDIFAYDIKCSKGIGPVMFSPHFTTNGEVTIQKVEATACAFAVRVEHGFIEVFDEDSQFPTNDDANRELFKQFIENQFDLPAGVSATSGNPYKRNNGQQWAVRLSSEGSMASRNAYISAQLGNLQAGSFLTSSVRDIKAIYGSFGAKIKQNQLAYIPCDQWSKIKNPTTSLGMPNGFEYHGPSMALSINNTNGTAIGGNYAVFLYQESMEGFPANHLQHIKHDTPLQCTDAPNTITEYVASFKG
ncbi:hypothetical protein [Persicobacter diffluens]|uniref:Pectate lyase superfamily protein domain-containing protein n=1 Tax=Persicobacter diffluens TaxID=981 RepID=A0AAN5AMY3_9BACT|nr:hypothetical protein PEDI_48240 [Persicobacter diffluens]